MSDSRFEPLSGYREYEAAEMARRAREFYEEMRRRRTVRHFSQRSLPTGVIEDCLRTAMTAPSGANMQPWHFVVVRDSAIKGRIRAAAEEVEREFYSGRAPEAWLQALAPLGTDASKPFLETAPCLIVIFAQLHGLDRQGQKVKHYYVNESVGIATGFLIAAIHHAGLACLTHTPAPMRFLNEVLDRPDRERPYLILAVGYPASDAEVPRIDKKQLRESCQFV